LLRKNFSSNLPGQSLRYTVIDANGLFCHDLPTQPLSRAGKILVSGASGYIGGRLVPELLARNYEVRIMVRADADACKTRWPEVECVVADALDPESLREAFAGVQTAYYLIHSLLLGPKGFEAAERRAAIHFRNAAAHCGVERIIYLGGLGDMQTSRSPHLQARMQVAEELKRGPVPVTVLRAAIIIGSGSASYEIIRHLVSRMPVLIIPRWARAHCQPIAIRDVIKYLVGVLENPDTAGMDFDIGGPEILTYELMLKAFAHVIRKKILFPGAPVSYLPIYAYLASLLTPVPAPITFSLMGCLKDEVVCRNNDIRRLIPFEPLGFREAVVRALTREEQDRVYTRWSDAYPRDCELALKLPELSCGPLYSVTYSIASEKSLQALYRSVCRVGGESGWFHNNWMWRVRGSFDRLAFGVGTQRGRKSASRLLVNDVIDFWRVEDLRENGRLLLRSEMKLPGRAWLEFVLDSEGERSRLSITAHFDTGGILGRIYWYTFWPFHQSIFQGLIAQIERRA
jgi:uncharacterized protein YbjT (DUF2867 family)